MAFGDHIAVTRPLGYAHHGIDVGEGEVIHFSGEPGQSKVTAAIICSSIEEFRAGGRIRVIRYGVSDSPDVVFERAVTRLGESGYNLFGNNCEHFARWCKTGQSSSEQVRRATHATGTSVATGVAASAGVAGVTTLGVAGVSGAGIMSGLATAGGLVGAGAAAGPVVLGTLPAVAGVAIVHSALADDESQPDDEREARRDGRAASAVGAVGALAAAPLAISAAGTTAGLSAAGISSGLAAIGATAGGGMVAGTAILVAAPVAAAAGLGFGIYAISKLIRD